MNENDGNNNQIEIEDKIIDDKIKDLNNEDKSKLIDLMDESIHILKEVYIYIYIKFINNYILGNNGR